MLVDPEEIKVGVTDEGAGEKENCSWQVIHGRRK